MKIEAAYFCETAVNFYRIVRYIFPEDIRCDNLTTCSRLGGS
jgi:hypothetical protein